uniref:Uncharacterized protein n=1 Tax=Aedes aegypti TaxID=7159 RepID=A0A0P6IVE3_AEDAE
MAISSTYFAREDIRKNTWIHSNGELCNQTDHVLVDGWDSIDIRSPNIGSDHYLYFFFLALRPQLLLSLVFL